ncbi:hypothetical protein GXW82_31395 [Streptacidiphilus sp. 4-A2]|nr:hypothetical protein [Streptacidiphilus sp. 4-A2]
MPELPVEPQRTQDVVICTPEGRAAAQRFHELTGRELVALPDLAAVRHRIRSQWPSTALLSVGGVGMRAVASLVLEAQRSGTGLGWIFGWQGEETAVAHAEKTARYRFARPGSALLWSAVPLGTVRDAETADLRVLGGPQRGLADLVFQPRSFTALSSHGLGIDMWLGDGLLCSIAGSAPELPSAAPVHPCMHGGPCLRASRGPDGLQEPARWAAADLASEVLLLDSCAACGWSTATARPAWPPTRPPGRRSARSSPPSPSPGAWPPPMPWPGAGCGGTGRPWATFLRWRTPRTWRP